MKPCQARIKRTEAIDAHPKQKWGPALLPAPTAPSEGSAGVRDLISRSFTVLDPGSPAQASLPIVVVSEDTSSIFRGPSWVDPLSRPLRPEGLCFRDRRISSSGASCQLVRIVSVFATEVAALINF